MFPQYVILFSVGAAAGRRGWLKMLSPRLVRRCGGRRGRSRRRRCSRPARRRFLRRRSGRGPLRGRLALAGRRVPARGGRARHLRLALGDRVLPAPLQSPGPAGAADGAPRVRGIHPRPARDRRPRDARPAAAGARRSEVHRRAGGGRGGVVRPGRAREPGPSDCAGHRIRARPRAGDELGLTRPSYLTRPIALGAAPSADPQEARWRP
jgi:hypothetical protein